METVNALLIDDDEKLGELLIGYFKNHQIELEHALSPSKGKEELKTKNPDVLLLDVMMPEQDGFSLCKEIRDSGNTIPILMLTARGETTDRVVGLEIGADDYLPKPFEPRELAARIHSLHRRNQTAPTKQSDSFGPLEIQRENRRVLLNNEELDLTTAEYEILALLSKSPSKKFTRDEIMNHLSGIDADAFSRSIDIAVSRLRTKLQDKDQKFIKTIWGTGYAFIGGEK